MDRRMGGPQSRSGRREEKKIVDPTGTRNSDYAIPAQPKNNVFTYSWLPLITTDTAVAIAATRTQRPLLPPELSSRKIWRNKCGIIFVPALNFSLTCDFSNDTAKSSVYTASNNGMFNELERMSKGTVVAYFEVLSEPQSGEPMYRPRFEHSISQMHVRNVTAWVTFLGLQ
jgi:hypothetical protein